MLPFSYHQIQITGIALDPWYPVFTQSEGLSVEGGQWEGSWLQTVKMSWGASLRRHAWEGIREIPSWWHDAELAKRIFWVPATLFSGFRPLASILIFWPFMHKSCRAWVDNTNKEDSNHAAFKGIEKIRKLPRLYSYLRVASLPMAGVAASGGLITSGGIGIGGSFLPRTHSFSSEPVLVLPYPFCAGMQRITES